jgi:hypothetical protein
MNDLGCGCHDAAHLDGEATLFPDLAYDRLLGAFTGFDAAARQKPAFVFADDGDPALAVAENRVCARSYPVATAV